MKEVLYDKIFIWVRLTPLSVYTACGERVTAEPADVAAERRAAAEPEPAQVPAPLALPTLGNINRGISIHAVYLEILS